MVVNSSFSVNPNTLSLRGDILPGPRKVTILWPLAHLLVGVQPPTGSLHHLCGLDQCRSLLEELEEESVELLLRRHVGVSPVQLGEI